MQPLALQPSGTIHARGALMAVLSIDITSREPFAEGQAFGESGAYEEIKGTLTYGVDPSHAANAGIIDLQYAPRDAAGLVRFRSDFAILKPVDDARSEERRVG